MTQNDPPISPAAIAPLDYFGDEDARMEARVVKKVMLRLIPFMVLLYLFNYIDRVNVSFAKADMNISLGLNDAVYGLGVSIFFIGYFLFEIPSNLMMQRVGARWWMARIMISWGLISIAMMFVKGPNSFYLLRFLLGAAEAGFFPGMILYLTYWIPQRQRARAIAWFMTSTALSGVVAGVLAGMLLGLRGFGLQGWQWLFLLEGIPSVLLGISILFILTDTPEQAKWLEAEERNWLVDRMRAEQAGMAAAGHNSHSLKDAMADPKVWLLSIIYAALMFGFYGINFWTAPVVGVAVKGSSGLVGFLSAIPFLLAAVGMVLTSRYADRTSRRRLMVVLGTFVGAAGMAMAAVTHSPITVIGALSVAAVGIWSALGPFWALPGEFLRGAAAAAGIALINSLGNLGGGFISANVMGTLKQHYQTYSPGLWITAGVLLVPTVMFAITMGRPRNSPEVRVDPAASSM